MLLQASIRFSRNESTRGSPDVKVLSGPLSATQFFRRAMVARWGPTPHSCMREMSCVYVRSNP